MIGMIAAALMLTAGVTEAPAGSGQSGDALRTASAGPVLRAIETYYPNEYLRLVESLRGQSGAADQNAQRARLLVEFFKRRGDELGNAPASTLKSINDRQLALIRRLARDDAGLCAEFASTFFIGRPVVPSAYEQQAAELGALLVEAAKQGGAQPRDPVRTTIDEGDAATWYEQLLQVEPENHIQVAKAREIDDSNGLSEMQCRVGVAVYAAIDKLPPDRAANIGSFLLKQTLADLGAD